MGAVAPVGQRGSTGVLYLHLRQLGKQALLELFDFAQ
jgi:hypothetical protein